MAVLHGNGSYFTYIMIRVFLVLMNWDLLFILHDIVLIVIQKSGKKGRSNLVQVPLVLYPYKFHIAPIRPAFVQQP